MSSAGKPDPFDLASLQASLSDSATRVSTIWISYLLFGLFLLVATGTATHRQLLLDEPLKLPVLGSDVPLVWFFTLSPGIFVLLHLYVMIQVLLLQRTAAAYNHSVDKTLVRPFENALWRERLANTLFAQAFAGAPRERAGWLGRMLRLIAWITLVASPLYILFAFQIVFLPYHSSLATFVQRALITVELFAAFAFWPLMLDARKDFDLSRVRRQLVRGIRLPSQLLSVRRRRWPRRPATSDFERSRRLLRRIQRMPRWLPLWWRATTKLRPACRHAGWIAVYGFLLCCTWLVLTFPGEFHLNLLTLQQPGSIHCNRAPFFQRFDRIVAANSTVVIDYDKFERLKKQDRADQRPWQGLRSKDLSGRDFSCGVFESADFSRTDLRGAIFTGSVVRNSKFEGAHLQGVRFEDADASNSHFDDVNLQGASLQRTIFKSSTLLRPELQLAQMQGVDFSLATLIEAQFGREARLEGANLTSATLRGAVLQGAYLQGASLRKAKLLRANLSGARLSYADLDEAELQAADLNPLTGATEEIPTDLTGAQLTKVWLVGANLKSVRFDRSVLDGAFLWRAKFGDCSNAFVIQPNFDTVIAPALEGLAGTTPPAPRPTQRGEGVEGSAANLKLLLSTVPLALRTDGNHFHGSNRDGEDQTITSCADNSAMRKYVEAQHGEFIGIAVCKEKSYGGAIAAGVIRNALYEARRPPEYVKALATEITRKDCAAASELSQQDLELLRQRAAG